MSQQRLEPAALSSLECFGPWPEAGIDMHEWDLKMEPRAQTGQTADTPFCWLGDGKKGAFKLTGPAAGMVLISGQPQMGMYVIAHVMLGGRLKQLCCMLVKCAKNQLWSWPQHPMLSQAQLLCMHLLCWCPDSTRKHISLCA